MICPKCSAETRVVDSRPDDEGRVVRRRRICESCGSKVVTYESTLNPIRHRASARAARKRWREKLTPEASAEKRRLSDLRYEAKRTSRETGRPLADVLREWNVPPSSASPSVAQRR